MPLAARRHALIAEVERAFRLRCGFHLDGKLIIGVSGGADSLALLIASAILRDRDASPAAYQPIAVHVNHQLRESADDDAQHVSAICEQLGVPCEIVHIAPAEMPGNVSANARDLRYQALLDAAKRRGATHVAVAHHAEDQLETILAALSRGSGVEAAAGMRWTRPLNGREDHTPQWHGRPARAHECGVGDDTHPRVNLVRPLLHATKADCITLCIAAQIQWREDPTNIDVAFSRARLRRDVLPVLEELWPGAAERAAATADVLAIAAEALEGKLAVIFGEASTREWNRHELAAHPIALLAAGLRRAAVSAGQAPDEVNHRQLLAAAEAIKDDERRPRAFALGGLTVNLTAKSVRLTD